MKDGELKYLVSLVTVVLFAAGCAKQSSPAGGPKDITPPVVEKSIPPSGTTMFKENRISIAFDEYFVLDKLNEKFMISPPVKNKPKITTKGKILNIGFSDPLKDSTTYTLYFQDIIRDLNENNPIPNFQYVFSTGNVLDSLSVNGNVVLARNLESAKNILLMLYSNQADSAPQKLLPDYLTVADVNGYFRINNVKGGEYRLFALADENNNNKYDAAGETFAFIDSVIHVNPFNNFLPPDPVMKDSIVAIKGEKETKVIKDVPFFDGEHKLYLFAADKKARYLSSSDRKMAWQFMYYLSLPPDSMKFEFRLADPGSYSYFTEKNVTGDTIMIWLRDSALYLQPVIKTLITYPFTDTTGSNIYRTDTIHMRFTIPKPGRGKPLLNPLKINSNIPGGGIKPGQKIIYSSPTPLRLPDTSKMKLYELKGKDRIQLPVIFQKDSTNSRKLILTSQFKEGGKYLFITDKGSFSNIFGERSDSAGLNISVRAPNSYGHLTIDVLNGKGNLIIQLLDSKENVIEQRFLINSGKADFPLLERGLYRIKVVYDVNGDGKWTTGDYLKRLQPEPVSFFPREIDVKTDWEIVEEWDVGTIHQKEKILREKKEKGN